MIGLVIAAALALQAANWVRINSDADGSVVYVNAKTSTPDRVWVKWDYSANKKERANYALVLYRVNCGGNTITYVSRTAYSAAGQVLESSSVETYRQKAQPVVPESIGESIFEAVCPG